MHKTAPALSGIRGGEGRRKRESDLNRKKITAHTLLELTQVDLETSDCTRESEKDLEERKALGNKPCNDLNCLRE